MRNTYQPSAAQRLGVVILIGMLGGGLLLGVLRMQPGPALASASPAPSYSVPGESNAQAIAFLQQQFPTFVNGSQALAPTPLLSPDVRSTIQGDMNAVASCMQLQGIADFPVAPASYGDGHTPAPVIGGPVGSDMASDSPAWRSAINACSNQFDRLHADGAAAAGSGG